MRLHPRQLFACYSFPMAACGFVRGFNAQTDSYSFRHQKLLIIQKMGLGFMNAMYYVIVPAVPLIQLCGRIEIERSPQLDKYSSEYSWFYKEWTFMSSLPPRK